MLSLMKWVWQQKDWPKFVFDASALISDEQQFHRNTGRVMAALNHLEIGRLLNERQTKVILRIFKEGIEGFKGGLSAGNYQAITGASPATTTRDLNHLCELGALTKEGQGKHTRYYLVL